MMGVYLTTKKILPTVSDPGRRETTVRGKLDSPSLFGCRLAEKHLKSLQSQTHNLQSGAQSSGMMDQF